MKKILEFVRTNKIFKVVIFLLAFIPLINLSLLEKSAADPYNTLWIGFYACVLICLSFGKSLKEIVVKVIVYQCTKYFQIVFGLVLFLVVAQAIRLRRERAGVEAGASAVPEHVLPTEVKEIVEEIID